MSIKTFVLLLLLPSLYFVRPSHLFAQRTSDYGCASIADFCGTPSAGYRKRCLRSICPQRTKFHSQKHKVAKLKDSFQMRVRPSHIVVYGNQSILIKVALKNMTNHDAYIRLWLSPVPFGPHTDLHCFMLRCRNQITGEEVQYTWPPTQRLVSDAKGKEFPNKISPSGSIIASVNLRDVCVLSPGKYVVEMQYDTRFTPSWVKPDKRAWHGITNKVTVKLQVLK